MHNIKRVYDKKSFTLGLGNILDEKLKWDKYNGCTMQRNHKKTLLFSKDDQNDFFQGMS